MSISWVAVREEVRFGAVLDELTDPVVKAVGLDMGLGG